MSNLVDNLNKGQNLSLDESKALFRELMEGKYEENKISVDTNENVIC